MNPNFTIIHGIGKYQSSYITFECDTKALLKDYDAYEAFVKACEATVRNDDRYTTYVGKLRKAGFDHCAVLGKATEGNDSVKLEMHHGPIFNLFDICDIVLRHMAKDPKWENTITTYDVGDEVLSAHDKGWIQLIMLSETAHQAAHKADLFLSIKSSYGRIDKFIDHYSDGMDKSHWEMINHYLEECKRADFNTLDQSIFDTAEKLKSFK